MSPPSGIITLLTDFGHRDPFVGMLKGRILARFPAARWVDLTHEIPPQDVRAGAYWLARSHGELPPGTVHLAVVDPGVGTERPLVVVVAARQLFVLPDNGLVAEVAARHPVDAVHRIERARCGLPTPSRTFHGRDVLAPVAAALAAGGLTPAAVGPRAALTGPTFTPARVHEAGIDGAVIVVDRFGNLLTDIPSADVARLADSRLADAPLADAPLADAARRGELDSPREVWVSLGDRTIPVRGTYADVAPGELVALDNAHGDLEIARRDGSAAELLGLGAGTPVRVRHSPRAR